MEGGVSAYPIRVLKSYPTLQLNFTRNSAYHSYVNGVCIVQKIVSTITFAMLEISSTTTTTE